jgi:hypothetical protein
VPFGDKKRRKEQCKTYKGFFKKKMAQITHILRWKKKIKYSYLDSKFQPIWNIGWNQ